MPTQERMLLQCRQLKTWRIPSFPRRIVSEARTILELMIQGFPSCQLVSLHACMTSTTQPVLTAAWLAARRCHGATVPPPSSQQPALLAAANHQSISHQQPAHSTHKIMIMRAQRTNNNKTFSDHQSNIMLDVLTLCHPTTILFQEILMHRS